MYQLINDKKIQILDGGMGRELKRIGAPFAQPEWSALALMQEPEYIKQVHQNFIKSGADIITTNTYSLVPFHIGYEMFKEQAFDLAKLAAQIANNCKGEGAKVAGCIPPAFGSYEAHNFIADKASEIIIPLIKAQEELVDFWIVETVSSFLEAKTILEIIKKQSNKPIWISFTLNNRIDMSKSPVTLRSGEKLGCIQNIIKDVEAILFNCSQPEEMEDAIKIVNSMSKNLLIGAYANNFSEINRTDKANEGISNLRDDITPEVYLEFAKKWSNAGASIIGGCCGIGPKHIKCISNYFKN